MQKLLSFVSATMVCKTTNDLTLLTAGNAALFKGWADIFVWLEVIPVELPGHGSRASEEALSDLQELVEELAYSFFPLNKRYAFFGVSMGGVVAFELARYLKEHLGTEPAGFFVASEPGPGII